jgi:sigma-B regulation protein RsbU (phosphoserine phosphatase)
MYLTLWYGVYRPTNRTLSYGSAGHPPALLIGPEGEGSELRTPCLPIGVLPDVAYESARVRLAPGARLFIFTDGAYEIRKAPTGEMGTLEDFLELLAAPSEPGLTDAARVDKAVRAEMREGGFPDDFTLLVATMT